MTTPSLPAPGHGEVAGLVEELRAGLEGVTPGPWTWGARYVAKPIKEGVAYQHIAQSPSAEVEPDGGQWDRDAAHIARCSPDNIAKLLDHIGALSALTAASTPSPVEARADGVRVKALEWRAIEQARSSEDPTTEEIGDYEAISPFGPYYVECGFGSDSYVWSVSFCGDFIIDKDDPDEAKAAAQADYEARIRSALEGGDE